MQPYQRLNVYIYVNIVYICIKFAYLYVNVVYVYSSLLQILRSIFFLPFYGVYLGKQSLI